MYSSVATKDGTDFSKLVEEYDPRKLNDPNYKHYQAFQRFAFLDEARIEANEFIKPILKKIFTDTDRQSLQIAHKYESSGIATGYVDKAKAGTGGDIFEMYIDFSQINQGVQRTLETEARKLVGKYNKALLDEKPVDNILKEISMGDPGADIDTIGNIPLDEANKAVDKYLGGGYEGQGVNEPD